MAVDRNAEHAQAYAAALASNDLDALDRLRTPDFVEDWPQSGERIVGHAQYRAIHDAYPGGYPQGRSAGRGRRGPLGADAIDDRPARDRQRRVVDGQGDQSFRDGRTGPSSRCSSCMTARSVGDWAVLAEAAVPRRWRAGFVTATPEGANQGRSSDRPASAALPPEPLSDSIGKTPGGPDPWRSMSL